MRRLVLKLLATVLALHLATPAVAQVPNQNSQAMREFILSCSYGVMAGTLVGAATLAFSDRPGSNLNRVARGASIGLYAGILLGVFVVYGGDSGPDEDEVLRQYGGMDLNSPASASVTKPWLRQAARLQITPILGAEQNLEGAHLQAEVWRF
ncbi:MAG TPA: hypothetical protein PLZ57_13740 [Pseudobdellovibrionaceae bacterium]|nr:hypothetical protein [Pseudobdellovibrionaceae bacterium]